MRAAIRSAPVLLLVALAACGGATPTASPSAASPSGVATASAGASAAGSPAISPGGATSTATASNDPNRPTATITHPTPSQNVRAGVVQVTISVTNFTVVNKMGDPPSEGEGHVYYYLDVDHIPTKQGQEATVQGEGRYVAVASRSYIWNDVTPGKHTFGVQLVKNNHRPLAQPATDEITITVGG